jgi:dTDP-4-amino-4,6-dideoxygalactose transaminase
MPLKKKYRPAGNSIGLKRTPVSTNLFHPCRYQLFQSGTAALSAAVSACVKLKRTPTSKPEIIVPAYACPDLISAILFAGVTPIPCDLAENSPVLSVEHIRGRITADTVAIISINFLGLPGNLAELKSICANQKLFLIYDCAQWFPLAKEYRWPGDFNIISFGRGKPVNLLHGGAVIPANPDAKKVLPVLPPEKRNSLFNLLQMCKVRLYNFLIQPIVYRFVSQLPGLNIGLTLYKPLATVSSMNSFYSELIEHNVNRFRSQNNALQYLHQRMSMLSHPLLTNLVSEELDTDPGYLLRYPILIKNTAIRDRFYEQTRNYGTSLLYQRPLNQIIGLENILDKETPYTNASHFADHLVTLPCHEDIDESVVDIIVDALNSLLPGSSE